MTEQAYYQQLAEAVGAGESNLIPKIFEELIDDREAKVLLAAAPPATIDEISEKSGVAAREIEAMIDPLFQKGLLFKSKKPEGIKYYRVRTVPQMHDATALYSEASKETLDLWKEYMATDWPAYMKAMESVIPNPVTVLFPLMRKSMPSPRFLPLTTSRNPLKAPGTWR
jgi:hypothetical protein